MSSGQHAPPRSEWIGGRLLSPFYITEGTPYRPEIILWMEQPEDLILSFKLIGPDEAPISLIDALREAIAAPMAGPPRRPARVRVADAASARELERAFPDIEVVNAPTPELDHILHHMAQSAATEDEGDPPSYLEYGRISAGLIEELFRSAQVLYGLAPWKVATDGQVLRLDIPALGVEGACLSIIGALGESLGFVIFPSLVAFESFVDATENADLSSGPIDLGTTSLLFTYEAGRELPPVMLREAIDHGWPVADAEAYPVVQHRDRDGIPRPLTEHDIRVASACATSLSAFFVKHRGLFERDIPDEPVCETYFDSDDLEVRFTVPYEAADLFEVNMPPRSAPTPPKRAAAPTPKISRNQPCPCGSGLKYKKCCMPKAQSETTPASASKAIHEMDARLVERMMRYGVGRFGTGWHARAAADFQDPEASDQLLYQWAVHHILIDEKPLAQWLLEARKAQLSNQERAWLEAQRAAWLSPWEALEVEPGRGIRLRDLLTGEERTVLEASASKTIVTREVLLGRIVDCTGLSLLCGVHPRSLPPEEADAVLQRVRKRLRRKRAVPIERLQEEKIGRHMIQCWEEKLEECDLRAQTPRRLQNTDGDDLLITIDHFEFDSGKRREIEKRLEALEDVAAPEPDEPNPIYAFLQSPKGRDPKKEMTLIGAVFLSDGQLRLETNSVRRADVLRKRLESGLGTLIRHRIREHADPTAMLRDPQRSHRKAQGDRMPPDVENRVILEMKARHYADWPDHPVPALNGKTPRAAVRTKAGREQVNLLLKSCENMEARSPAGQRFDFTTLRRELGLEE